MLLRMDQDKRPKEGRMADLIRQGRLVAAMPDRHFPIFDLSVVHVANRHLSRSVRAFKELAAPMATSIFPELPV
jgi:hypothetical protein